MTKRNIIPTNRGHYDPIEDVIEYPYNEPDYEIVIAHELGHRFGIKIGKIKEVLVTRGDEIQAETYAWKYAARVLRHKGLWDDRAKAVARRSLSDHGIYWDNFKDMDRFIESL